MPAPPRHVPASTSGREAAAEVHPGHSYDWCINPRARVICITLTPLPPAHHHQDWLHHMAAGAAALYVTKYSALDSLYSPGFASFEVHLVPRILGLAGCAENADLCPAEKSLLRSGFLSSVLSLCEMLGFQSDWLGGSLWVSIM